MGVHCKVWTARAAMNAASKSRTSQETFLAPMEGALERPGAASLSSGNKYVPFKKLHENYITNASGRDLCVVVILARISKEKHLFPDELGSTDYSQVDFLEPVNSGAGKIPGAPTCFAQTDSDKGKESLLNL